MKKLIFPGVWIQRVSFPTFSTYIMIKGQGLHSNSLQHIEESRSCGEVWFQADLSYDPTIKLYDINSKGSSQAFPPTGTQIAEVGSRVAEVLREEGLYRAEYSQEGLTFSQMNN